MRKTWIFSCFILLSVLWCLPINGQQLASYAKDGVIRVKLDPAVAEQLGNTPPDKRWNRIDRNSIFRCGK